MPFCDFHYFSKKLGIQSAAYVLLPEVGEPPFPTLYLLHGYSDDHTVWHRRTRIEAYVANLPLIVVMPHGGHSFYCDAVEGYPYASAIGEELPEIIERNFPAQKDRGGRCLAGLSMGGYGAFKLALTYPDRFAAAVSHSGALAFGHYPYTWDGNAYRPEQQRILGQGYIGGPNDLFAQAEKVDPDLLPALRFDCGTEDFLYKDNVAYRDHLESAKIPHEYAEFPGQHNWDYWDEHIQESLEFFQRKMNF
jgi:S-formylglutathione hydrolase FrmB